MCTFLHSGKVPRGWTKGLTETLERGAVLDGGDRGGGVGWEVIVVAAEEAAVMEAPVSEANLTPHAPSI